jgi:hypothetical protein
MVAAFCFQTEARMEINLHIIPEDTFGDNRTFVMFNHLADQEDLEMDRCCMRGLGKSMSKTGSWNRSITSRWGYGGLQPWPPSCRLQLEDELPVQEGCSVVDASKMDVASQMARRPGMVVLYQETARVL